MSQRKHNSLFMFMILSDYFTSICILIRLTLPCRRKTYGVLFLWLLPLQFWIIGPMKLVDSVLIWKHFRIGVDFQKGLCWGKTSTLSVYIGGKLCKMELCSVLISCHNVIFVMPLILNSKSGRLDSTYWSLATSYLWLMRNTCDVLNGNIWC